jgi:hypothetical protein
MCTVRTPKSVEELRLCYCNVRVVPPEDRRFHSNFQVEFCAGLFIFTSLFVYTTCKSCRKWLSMIRWTVYASVSKGNTFFSGVGPRSRRYGRTAALRLIVQSHDEDDYYFCPFPRNGAPVQWNWQGKTEVFGGKTSPSATLSSTNPTRIDAGSNLGLRSGRPASNLLSHGMV